MSSSPSQLAQLLETDLQLRRLRRPKHFRSQLRRIALRHHGSDLLVARDKTLVAKGVKREATTVHM